jgi:NADH:ubiquinone reductase (H+-translocating)
LTFVVIGGGPTGVEMAGAIAELARMALARDFRNIDPAAARIVLVEAGPRILPALPRLCRIPPSGSLSVWASRC